jgi:hypothetical protein
MNARSMAVLVLSCFIWSCGDKVPESQAAKRVGEAPKQIIDKAASDAAAAIQQGEERTRKAAD